VSFDKDYLWNLFKPSGSQEKLYVDMMNTPSKIAETNYAVLERAVFDEPKVFGDGTPLYRNKEFNIRVHANSSDKALEISDRYKTIMKTNQISYDMFGPTLDPSTNRFSILLTGSYMYAE
jgi:hypothetical protein